MEVTFLPPHHLLIEGDGLQLSVHVVLVAVLGRVGERSNLDLSLGDSAHVVVLNGDPVHQRAEDLVLDLLDAAVLVEVFGVGHHCGRDDLKQAEYRQVYLLPHQKALYTSECSAFGLKYFISEKVTTRTTL